MLQCDTAIHRSILAHARHAIHNDCRRALPLSSRALRGLQNNPLGKIMEDTRYVFVSYYLEFRAHDRTFAPGLEIAAVVISLLCGVLL